MQTTGIDSDDSAGDGMTLHDDQTMVLTAVPLIETLANPLQLSYAT